MPRRFQMSILLILSASHPSASYTSLKRCKQLGRSNSKFTYKTRPLAHCQPSHFRPSAMAIQSSIKQKLFPALDGPANNSLCPILSTLSINGGASSGRLSQTSAKLSGSGKLSFIPSIHSFHSAQSFLPMLVSIINCFLSPRTTPGIRLKREGFLFCLSTSKPFLAKTL